MKNTLVFLKQPRMDTFSLSEAVKKFLGEKMKTTNRIATKSPRKFSHKAIFSKCSNLTHFWDFQIFKTIFFCHFWFPIKKNFFLNYKLTFVFPKKFIALYHKYSQNCGYFYGGGWKMATISPPPKSKCSISPTLS